MSVPDNEMLSELARSAGEVFAEEFANASGCPFDEDALRRVGRALLEACDQQFRNSADVLELDAMVRLREVAMKAFVDRVRAIERADPSRRHRA